MTRGLSSVYGFIAIYLLTIAALEASSSTIGSLVAIQASHDRADQLESVQKIEHLTLTLSNGTLTLANDGLVTSTVRYLHFASATTSADLTLNQRVAVGKALQLAVPTPGSFSAVTSLGNVFLLSSPAVTSGGGKYAVVFDATGVAAGPSNVLSVDGTAYTLADLPVTFNWASGEVHSFAYVPAISGGAGTRVGWSDSRGLSTMRSGQVTVKQSGQVIADYLTQYFLTVVGGGNLVASPPSPTNDSWFDSATTVYVTTDHVWSVIANQSRSDLISWSVDGATPTTTARSGTGTFTTGGIVMNGPHTLTFKSLTQYHLTLSESIPSSGTVPPLTFTDSYVTLGAASQILGNSGFESSAPPYSYQPWTSAIGCVYPGLLVTLPVHSGSYAYQLEGAGQVAFYCEGVSQTVPLSLPAGAVVTSISSSLWLYDSANGDSAYLSAIPSTGTCQARTQTALSTGAWTQLTTSVSGCSIQPASIQLQSDLIAGCASLKGTVIYCGSGYADDGVLAITYSVPSSGAVASGTNSFVASSSGVSYTYSVTTSFPAGVVNKQLQTALPGDESISEILIGSGPAALQSSEYGLSGTSVTIPDSTIASHGGSYTLIATASGGYSTSQSGSQTNDNWYDSGSTASISASATGPYSFGSWSGSSALANQNSPQTTVVMNTYYEIDATFRIGP